MQYLRERWVDLCGEGRRGHTKVRIGLVKLGSRGRENNKTPEKTPAVVCPDTWR